MAGVLSQQAQAGGGSDVAADPKMQELFKLITARTLEALAHVGKDFDAALRADPVQAAVQFGTSALRSVVGGATKAGVKAPFEVIFAAGLQTIKEIGAIAAEKGYLPDDQIEVFLKEALQQSLQRYTQLDMKDGLISPEQRDMLGQKLQQGAQQAQPGQPAGEQEPDPADPNEGNEPKERY